MEGVERARKKRDRGAVRAPKMKIFCKEGSKLVWILKFRQWFCRPSFETALAPEEIPWRIGGNSSPLFPLVVFILPSDDQGGLNERGEGRALTPLCPMVKDYPQSFFGMKPSKTPHIRFFINNFLVPNQPPKD